MLEGSGTEAWHIRDGNYCIRLTRHEAYFLWMALKDMRTGHKSPLPVLDIYRDLEEELHDFLESDPRDGTKRT